MLYSRCIFAFLDNRLAAALIRAKALAVLLLIGVSWGGGLAAELTGRVVNIPDGDTITIEVADRTRHRVRLDGIDAPERTQPYSQISRKNLISLVGDQPVTVESHKVDRHGRAVGVVRIASGEDVGLEQIKAGLAWHFRRYEHDQTPENRAAYATAQALAKASKRGLWRDAAPVAPWDFRAAQRDPQPTP